MAEAKQRVEFKVLGTPRPKGSTRSFYDPRRRRIVTLSDCATLKPWESMIRASAGSAWQGEPAAGPMVVSVTFHMPRPRSHYGRGRNVGKLKPSAPRCHTSKPDIDKLTRGLLDGMTQVIFRDDRQVMSLRAYKTYASPADAEGPHAAVIVQEL